MEEAERSLSSLVLGHLVLELAALLCEGANALVNPLVAVYLDLSARSGACGNNAVDLILVLITLVHNSMVKIQGMVTWRLSGRGVGCYQHQSLILSRCRVGRLPLG